MSAPSCACTKRHSPPCLELNAHHAIPQSWGGQTVPENLVTLCMNQHGNVHHGLNLVVHAAYANGGDGTMTPARLAPVIKGYAPFTRALIRRALEGVGWKVPANGYTLTHPGDSHA